MKNYLCAMQPYNDNYFMLQALEEAKKAAKTEEVPIGAVVTAGGRIIARGHNQTELLNDVTAHAEMIAITAAADYLGAKYLNDCTLYVTLEPCPMCAGALAWSQIGKVVWGADDTKRGFMRFGRSILHPKTDLACGIQHEACGDILKAFFEKKRD